MELWKSDGTAAGTVMVKDINLSGSSNPSQLTAFGNTIYFAATDGTNGYELWKSDGTPDGTVMVRDINPSGDSNPESMAAFGSAIYFDAYEGTYGNELWKSDGTRDGTVLVKDFDVSPGGNGSPYDLVTVGTTLYLSAFSGTGGNDLWKSDGTRGGTVLVKDFSSTAYSYTSDLTEFGGALYFRAWDGTQAELWKSDGTEVGTTMVYDMNGGNSSSPSDLTPHGELLYFQAFDDDNGTEMYFSDGTQAPMRIPGPTAVDYVRCDCYQHPIQSTSVGVFFTYYDATVGHELGFIPDPLPATNTNGSALTLALLALSGALAAGAVIARRKELRAN